MGLLHRQQKQLPLLLSFRLAREQVFFHQLLPFRVGHVVMKGLGRKPRLGGPTVPVAVNLGATNVATSDTPIR